ELCDDGLTEYEAWIVCGCYIVYTTQMQKSIVSWWPLPSRWECEDNGQKLDYWSPFNEYWYEKRVKDIRSGVMKPETNLVWRSWLKGNHFARTL
ncbi:hypothetical protein BDQ17DRAFT_1233360, partial [Cyathus striatus]